VGGNAILHAVAALDGANELMPGVFYGGSLQAAGEIVKSRAAEVSDFRFFVGRCAWGPGQLEAELARGGSWWYVAAAPALLMAPVSAPAMLYAAGF
jgi:putative transcriptional regulator